MKASHNLAGVSVTFDEDRLVPNAGLVAPALLVQRLGIARLVDRQVKLAPGAGAAFCGAKAVTVLGAMLAGGDSSDDVDVLRAGAAEELFDDVRAPSTIGTWLRAFTWSNVRQFDAVLRETLVRGYHPVLATLADTGEVLHARMRGGSAASARGAKTFAAEALSRVRAVGATGELTVRAESAFYSRGFIGACRAADAHRPRRRGRRAPSAATRPQRLGR